MPFTNQITHADRYVNFSVYHNDHCPSPAHGAYGHYHGYAGVIHDNIKGHHGHSPVSPAENTANFHVINSIPHSHSHRNHSGIAFSSYGHSQHVDSNPEHSNHHGAGSLHCSNSKGHFTVPLVQHTRVGYAHSHVDRAAGTVSHVGHLHAAGGAAGAAGAKGIGGAGGAGGAAGTNGTNGSTTAGTNGSTTAGTNASTTAGTNGSTTAGTNASTTAGTNASTTAGGDGQSGGGGGIIIITESALPGSISTSTTGGTINANTASAGTVLVIINQ